MKKWRKTGSKKSDAKKSTIFEKLFLLNWKRDLEVILLWVFSVAFHSAIFRIYMVEETFFFIMAVFAIPAYLVVAIIYTLDFHRRRMKKQKR